MFVQVIEGRLRDRESVPRHLATWTSDAASGAEGWLGSIAGLSADGTFLAIAGFESEAAARTNGERPEQMAWWEEISERFDGDITLDVSARTVAGPSDRTLIQVVHVAVPLGAAGIVVALGPALVRGTFSSTESVLRVATVVAGWVLFSRLMRRVVPSARVRAVVKAVVATLLLWRNVAPYLKDDVKIAGSFPESLTTASGSSGPGTGAPWDVPPTTPAQPVQLASGRFRGLAGHRGAGQASVFRQPDGSHVVAFRDLSVSSVPDPVLYLVPGADQERLDGATRLGRFDPGGDRYEIPAGADLNTPLTVLIWCQRFAVPVAGATQAPV